MLVIGSLDTSRDASVWSLRIKAQYITPVLLVGFVLICLHLVGCKKADITPVDKSFHISPPDIVVTFPNGPPAQYVMVLNGVDISKHFIGDGNRRVARGSNIAKYLWQGKNYFQMVEFSGRTDEVMFIYDSIGPDVHITNVIKSGNVVVEGHLKDPSTPRTVKLNGQNLTLDDQYRFRATTNNAEYFYFDTTDENGFSNRVTFHNDKSGIANAMGVAIKVDGRVEFDSIVQDAVTAPEFVQRIVALNPVLNMPFADWENLSIDVLDFSVSPPDVQMKVTNEASSDYRLLIEVSLDTVQGDLSGRATIAGVTTSANGSMRLVKPKISLLARVSIGRNGRLVADVQSLDARFESVDINWDNQLFIDAKAEIDNAVSSDFAADLTDSLTAPVATLLQARLDELEFESDITINGKSIDFKAIPESVSLSPGLMSFKVFAELSSDSAILGPVNLGYRYVDTPLPEPTIVGPDEKEHGVGVTFSINTINQAFWIADEAGFNEIFIDIPRKDRPDSNIPFRLHLKTQSAPYLAKPQEVRSLKSLVINDALVIGEIRLAGGRWVEAFTAEIDIAAEHEMRINSQNEVSLELIIVEVDSNNIKTSSDLFDIKLIDNLLVRYMPKIVPEVTRSISVVSLPRFLGFSYDPDKIWVKDINNQHFSTVGELIDRN